MPPDLLLSFYGDDLTGSTDAMEALTSHGVATALFLDVPTAAQLDRLGPVAAIGIAGTSRSEGPAWMDLHLTPALVWLRGRGASICHYKVCSTFDSSPGIGSIGKAIDIGAAVFGQATVPVVVGAPQIKRYTAFGTLFAGYREVFRIDRHPVMSRHPVTPMREADLRLHLAAQTERRIGLVDLAALQADDRDARIAAVLADMPGALLVDVADQDSQHVAGAVLWGMRRPGGLFVVGSSGVEYALLAAWRDAALVPGRADFAPPGAVDQLAVVSGSCSPTTARQIEHALADGFAGVAVDPRRLATAEELQAIKRRSH